MTQKALLGIQRIALGLLPISLCFWYSHTLISNPIEKVYFTYTDSLLFISDALALAAVLAWLVAVSFKFSIGRNSDPAKWGLILCLLALLSTLWSSDWRVSLTVSLHLWLVFGVFLSVRDQPETWRAIAIGFCAALLVQIAISFWQFGAQTTAFLSPLGMNWPGQITPATPGASIVEMPNGARWLRVYGSLPHPNLLGGLTLTFLAGPAALFLLNSKRQFWALILLAGGAALLILTFSRSAWVGLVAAGLVLIFQRRKFPSKQVIAAGLAVLTGLLSAAVPLSHLIFTRTGANSAATETFSNAGRAWLIGQALTIIQEHPIFGVGIGAYIVEYARRAPYGYLIEPVHSLPLLVLAELGLVGGVIGIGLGVCIIRSTLRAATPENVLFSALLIGLLVTSFFDHYLWTLAPGRMLLGLALGLWAGHAKQNQEANHATDPL